MIVAIHVRVLLYNVHVHVVYTNNACNTISCYIYVHVLVVLKYMYVQIQYMDGSTLLKYSSIIVHVHLVCMTATVDL